jgi:hypothetical protein
MDRLDNITFKHYAPVGQCIYCGTRDNLSEEHIVAYAIAGTMVLPEASCGACATITGRVEQKCCRAMFDRFRRFYGLPTRKGKKDRAHVTFTHMMHDGRVETTPIPTADHPLGLIMPIFDTPRILLGLPEFYSENIHWKLWRHGPPPEQFKQVAEKFGARAIAADMDFPSLGRMLAKTAHAYATAVLGINGFTPLLTPVIRGESNNWPHFVGGYHRNDVPAVTSDKEIHVLALQGIEVDGKQYLTCMVRFFSRFGAPTYECAVGLIDSAQLQRVADFVEGRERN